MQSLLLEDNDAAVAAGVNLMLLAGTTAAICQLQALSPAGRCQTFDAAADGYGRGEGCTAVILREFTGADSVHVLIRGSAVNQVWFLGAQLSSNFATAHGNDLQ